MSNLALLPASDRVWEITLRTDGGVGGPKSRTGELQVQTLYVANAAVHTAKGADMEYVASAARLIGSALSFVGRQMYDWIIAPFLHDASFRSGAIWGIVLTFVIGYLSRLLLYWWGRVLQFFAATKQPATKAGDSPYSTSLGCGMSMIKIILMVTFILVVLVPVVLAIFEGE